MARVTVEDCLDKVESRFLLILLASYRARMLSGGTKPMVSKDNDKEAVIALREVAADCLDVPALYEELIKKRQRIQFNGATDVFDAPDNVIDEDIFDAISDEQETNNNNMANALTDIVEDDMSEQYDDIDEEDED